jgi:hypothetical protein
MTEVSISSVSLPSANTPSRTSRDYNLHALLKKNSDQVLELLTQADPSQEERVPAEKLKTLAQNQIKAAFRKAAEEHYSTARIWIGTLLGAGGAAALGLFVSPLLAYGMALPIIALGAEGYYGIKKWGFMKKQTIGPFWWESEEPDPRAKGNRRIFEAAQKELEKITPKRAERILHHHMIELANE